MRVEFFINGFHQPELSYLGNQDGMPEIPQDGAKDIQPFLQAYKYRCVNKSIVNSFDPTYLSDGETTTILIYLEPQDELAKMAFSSQYGDARGDFSFPKSPYPLSKSQYFKSLKNR